MLETLYYFPCGIYRMVKMDYIDLLNKVSAEYIEIQARKQAINQFYPLRQTSTFQHDARIQDFVNFIQLTCSGILESQGYDTSLFQPYISELWCQDHYQNSSQPQHLHGYGNQLSGFYFLNVPIESPYVVIHDPRSAKVYANLPELASSTTSYASNEIFLSPANGLFMFMNSWLPHSFTKNKSTENFRLIHFNVSVAPKPPV